MKKTQKPKHLLISLFRGIYLSSYIQIQYELIDLCSPSYLLGVPTLFYPKQDCGLWGLGQRREKVESMMTVRCIVDGHFSWKGRRAVDLTYLGWEDALLWYFFCQLGTTQASFSSVFYLLQHENDLHMRPKSGVTVCDLGGRPFLSSWILFVFFSLWLRFLFCYLYSLALVDEEDRFI